MVLFRDDPLQLQAWLAGFYVTDNARFGIGLIDCRSIYISIAYWSIGSSTWSGDLHGNAENMKSRSMKSPAHPDVAKPRSRYLWLCLGVYDSGDLYLIYHMPPPRICRGILTSMRVHQITVRPREDGRNRSVRVFRGLVPGLQVFKYVSVNFTPRGCG